ncbi:MAG: FAD-dependent oxidoreductase [Bacteroidetes bacterium]|nr:FAD-dependent oxidoreductase [Bacteroidota bacterium]MDA1121476.1 FAD-dependent oxidoreductase [Bacteroidota bacterium]
MDNQNTFSPVVTKGLKSLERVEIPQNAQIVVVGAGAFGGWASLFLQRAGYRVTLIDQWGAGNSHSSSGGETRLIRCIYGLNKFYTSLANRSYDLWQENEKIFGQQYLFTTGCLWLIDQNSDDLIEKALPVISGQGLEYVRYEPNEAYELYPLLNVDNLSHVILEKKTGYLLARESCEAVKNQFIVEGGNYIQGAVSIEKIKGELNEISLDGGRSVSGDCFVFACGPWLKEMFGDVLESKLKITRQEVFYFGLPTNNSGTFESFPSWIYHSPPDFYYGIPSGVRRGFKIAFDRRGEEIDSPSTLNRTATKNEVERARQYIGKRFNGLHGMPLIESRVCQYSDTSDGNFIFDRHPAGSNVWLLGGGSGHGFKHGPALGELLTNVFTGKVPVVEMLKI